MMAMPCSTRTENENEEDLIVENSLDGSEENDYVVASRTEPVSYLGRRQQAEVLHRTSHHALGTRRNGGQTGPFPGSGTRR